MLLPTWLSRFLSIFRKTKRKFNLKRDTPDSKDIVYKFSAAPAAVLVDLRPGCPEVYNQLELGSCTGNAWAAAMQYDWKKEKLPFAGNVPSRLFIYYQERLLENTVMEDSGAMIRDGAKVLASTGVCIEKTWPYKMSRFNVKPSPAAYTDAIKHRAITYRRVSQSKSDIETVLASGYPIVFGISVFDSFESDAVARTGMVPMPAPSEQNIGGHAIMLVGYDRVRQLFTFRNSWGSRWGDKGYGYLPYAYVLGRNLASDFWTIAKDS